MENKTERFGKIENLDRRFDLEYWQSQGDVARFQAAWDLIVFAWQIKGKDVTELRLQRTVEAFGKLSG